MRDGEPQLGVTYHRMDDDFDTGGILAQGTFALGDDDWMPDLIPRFAELNAELLPVVFERVARGDPGDAQDDAGASYAGFFADDYGELDWSWPADEIHRRVRAWSFMFAWGAGARADLDGRERQLLKTRVERGVTDGSPGRRPAPRRRDGARPLRRGRRLGARLRLGGRALRFTAVPLSNDQAELVPRTAFGGPELRFELPGVRIGAAEYDEGPTGCTVFQFVPAGAACATDVRGGSPGRLGGFEWVHAICLAGGSLYGLEAATGVAAEILAQRGYEVGWTNIPNVSGAIVYDFGRRATTVYPDKALGRAALASAREGVFPLGARGAGRSVSVGKTFGLERGEPGGQGGAFRQVGATQGRRLHGRELRRRARRPGGPRRARAPVAGRRPDAAPRRRRGPPTRDRTGEHDADRRGDEPGARAARAARSSAARYTPR